MSLTDEPTITQNKGSYQTRYSGSRHFVGVPAVPAVMPPASRHDGPVHAVKTAIQANSAAATSSVVAAVGHRLHSIVRDVEASPVAANDHLPFLPTPETHLD